MSKKRRNNNNNSKRKQQQRRQYQEEATGAPARPPSLPESEDDEEGDDPIPTAPPLGPASLRTGHVLFSSDSRNGSHPHDPADSKRGKRTDRMGKAGAQRQPQGWERLRLMSLSPSSYRVGSSLANLHSLYQTVLGRSFSLISETEERLFWSTLLQGCSVLPLFMLIATACSNTAMGILFTAVGDIPHLQGWDDWVRLFLSTIGIMILLRNLLVSMYEMCIDSTAQYPLLNPSLLSRLRSIVAVRPHGLQRLITVLHINSCATLYGLTWLGIRMGNLPGVWLRRCHLFGLNTVAKLAAWQLYGLYEAFVKGQARPSARPNGNQVPPLMVLKGKHLVSLRRVRKGVILYISTSDVLLLLGLAANYLFRGEEGRELLGLMPHPHQAHDEMERRVVAFNCLALVLTNLAAFGMFSYESLTYGGPLSVSSLSSFSLFSLLLPPTHAHPPTHPIHSKTAHLLDRTAWTESIAQSRTVSLVFTCLAYAVSMHRHGYLPSFFTLLVVFNGLSLSKIMLWACIEVQRTLLPLYDTMRRHPVGVCLFLASYVLATRTPSDVILLTLFTCAVYWAFKVQIRPHYVDVWAFGLTGLAVLMALHQACYSALGPSLDTLFKVQLSDTHLNITSGLGPMSMALRPPAPPSSAPSSSFFSFGSEAKAAPPITDEALPAKPHQYPFCEMDLHGLPLIDYAGLCFMAYLKPDSPAFQTFYTAAFDQDEWEIKHSPGPRTQGAMFVDVYNKRLNTSVVAIRGTNPKNLFDVFQDMVMFNGAFCWDVVGMIVPLVQWLPSLWTANLLYLSYLPLKLKFESLSAYRDLSLHYHREVQEYVEGIRKDRQVVLTGHSLGGGIGKIVAARLGIPIVAISGRWGGYLSLLLLTSVTPSFFFLLSHPTNRHQNPAPGIYLSHKIFDVPRQNVDRYETNLISSEDVVPKVRM